MTDYGCFCGRGFTLARNQRKSLVDGAELFCSVSCFLSYLESLPKGISENYECVKSPFVSEPFDVWDPETQCYYRSWYEVYVARCFKEKQIKFDYEAYCIFIGQGHYTPDFWLPDYVVGIEVKGYWGTSAKKKYRKARGQGDKVILLPWHLAGEFKKLYGRKNESGSIVR